MTMLLAGLAAASVLGLVAASSAFAQGNVCPDFKCIVTTNCAAKMTPWNAGGGNPPPNCGMPSTGCAGVNTACKTCVGTSANPIRMCVYNKGTNCQIVGNVTCGFWADGKCGAATGVDWDNDGTIDGQICPCNSPDVTTTLCGTRAC